MLVISGTETVLVHMHDRSSRDTALDGRVQLFLPKLIDLQRTVFSHDFAIWSLFNVMATSG